MVVLLDPIQRYAQPQPRNYRSPNLLLHCGVRAVERVEIQRQESEEDYCWGLSLRNSHDKTFPAGICRGWSKPPSEN